MRLVPLDVRGADRPGLVQLLTGSTFPYHVAPRRSAAEVEAAIDSGRYDGADHATSWIDVTGHGRVGLAVLDDLRDATAMLDLRLTERFRGRGLAAPVLRAVVDHVVATYPDVARLEGHTREDNVPMRRAFLRAGWVKEAYYRDGWPVAGGAPRASVAYAVLRRDWLAGTSTPVAWHDGL